VACLEDASGEGLDQAKEHVRRRADKANRIGDPGAAGIIPPKRRRASRRSIHARLGTYCSSNT
jgi:hypothetical protein